MALDPMTRRELLRLAGMMAASTIAGCAATPGPSTPIFSNSGIFYAFIRSGRKSHVSNAAKKHNANRIYATVEAAMIDVPHPGDSSKISRIEISQDLHKALFGGGTDTVDLRQFYL